MENFSTLTAHNLASPTGPQHLCCQDLERTQDKKKLHYLELNRNSHPHGTLSQC